MKGNQGGKYLDAQEIKERMIRADLCEIAARHCFEHGTKLIDELLVHFDITRKPIKEKKW